jgi:hypothetical protein
MGMFDYLICNYPLPDGFVVDLEDSFQTKSFDNEMTTYHIGIDGTLSYEDFQYETVPEEERPWYGTDKFEGLGRLIGSLRRVNEKIIQLPDYHGDIRFYTSTQDPDTWHEYIARFTNGKVQDIKKKIMDS